MTDWVDGELKRNFRRASRKGESRLASEPRAVRARYDARKSRLVVELSNGVVLMLPPALLQGLGGASALQLSRVEITPLGGGLRWEALDVDLRVAGLASGIFGSRAWMSELARQAGSRTSKRKATAARENGKKGGRPPSRKSR